MKPVAADAFARETSPTAANSTNRLFGPSGAMDYLVILAMSGGAQKPVKVNAATGDDAAAIALGKNPGWKVGFVGPFTDAPPAIDPLLAA